MSVQVCAQSFHCDRCRRWTESGEVALGGSPWCADCGDWYACGECGWCIATNGECRRNELNGIAGYCGGIDREESGS